MPFFSSSMWIIFECGSSLAKASGIFGSDDYPTEWDFSGDKILKGLPSKEIFFYVNESINGKPSRVAKWEK